MYEYMKKVSIFLHAYRETEFYILENEEYDSFGWLRMWRKHVNDLSNELFNSFILGNLISVSAMTRALMECYVYISIIQKERSQQLLDEWWLCNEIHKTINNRNADIEVEKTVIKMHCAKLSINFDEKWKFYAEKAKKEGAWLRELMGDRGVGFRALCE